MRAAALLLTLVLSGCATGFGSLGEPAERTCGIYLPAVYATMVEEGIPASDDAWAAYELLYEEMCG